ncbi:MAG: hypothetical protein ACLQU2_00220 [Candidatus Binataceae bacterium]
MYYGPEFRGRMDEWDYTSGVPLQFIEAGKPIPERFHRVFQQSPEQGMPQRARGGAVDAANWILEQEADRKGQGSFMIEPVQAALFEQAESLIRIVTITRPANNAAYIH